MGDVPIEEYYLMPGDTIEIFVWQNADLSKDVLIGPDGKISFPMIGRINAKGLTVGQLEDKLTEELSKYIRHPEVSVMMKKFSGNQVTVLGEVEYPGIYATTGPMDLIDAIALAGDFSEAARRDSVIVLRNCMTEKPEVMRINVLALLNKGIRETNIALKNDDIVYVPKSFIHNLNKFLGNLTAFIQQGRTIMQLRTDIQSGAIYKTQKGQ
jgi:polysaccharide export outer membrane protein